jgi:Acetyltransferase (GNAT) family
MSDVAYEIRPMRFDERAEWEPLWHAYQAFYKVVISDETTSATWARLHDPDEPMGILGAYIDGRLCGIAHYLFHRSCWTVGDYCYLQDLFVAENARHLGLLAHPREQCECAGTLRQAGGALRVHPISQTFLTRFARPKDDTCGDGADRP